MSIRHEIRREARVAFSKRAQPVWFRVVKWIVAIAVSVTLWRTAYFWWWLGGAIALGLTLHFIWRWKTEGWTKAWGGWDDVDAADGDQ
jgi:hypothetical protein